jgi:predicted RNA binding protein YcfA (HicA-like mRNA interferase family)
MATKKIKINFKMPTPTAAERLHAQQQKIRKASGLPDPSEYKKKLDSMKSEEVEQIDEISAELKASYVAGAKKQIKQSMPFTKKTDEYRDIAKNFIAKRQKGIAKANEEVEQLDEMPESNMKTKDVHSHLKKSGWSLARSKGGHDVYKHPKAKHSIPVPRHNQLKAPLIRGIMKASKVSEEAKIEEQVRTGQVSFELFNKKGRHFSGPAKKPFQSFSHVTPRVNEEPMKEGVTLGRLVGRGNIYQYDRNPGPRDGSELEHVPFHAKTEKQKKLQKALTDLGNKMKQTHPKLREATDDDKQIVITKKGTNIKKKIAADVYDVFKHHGFRKEEKDSQEYDYEGDMAKSDLRSIIHNAQTLHDMLDDNTNLAEWVQSKITLAEDYISTVTNYMRSEMNEETVQEDKHDYQRKIEKNNKKFIAASKRQKNPLTNVHTAQTKQKPVKEDVELDEMIVVKTNKPIGTRVADIGPGGKEYNVKTNKAYDDAKKRQPQGADFAAQRRKERLAKSGRMDEKENLPGLWANIHAKRKRGEPPAKPGDKDYPKDLETVRAAGKNSVKESAAEPTEGEMKGKQQMSRRAQIVKDAVKGKKSDSPDKFQKDPELSSEIHKT